MKLLPLLILALLSPLAQAQSTRPTAPGAPKVWYDLTALRYAGQPNDGLAVRRIAAGNNARKSILQPTDWFYAADTFQETWVDNGLPKILDDEGPRYNFGNGDYRDQGRNYAALARKIKDACPNSPLGICYVLPWSLPDDPIFVEAVKPLAAMMDFAPLDFSDGKDLPRDRFDRYVAEWPALTAKQAGWDIPLVPHVGPWGMTDAEFDYRLRKLLAMPRVAGVVVWMGVQTPADAPELPPDMVGITHRAAQDFRGPRLTTRRAPDLAAMDDAGLIDRGRQLAAEINARQANAKAKDKGLADGKGEIVKQLGAK